MSRTYSADLFDLIKSLNPSEKGYIKKFALRSSTKGNRLYLSLFDAIDKQKVYNEKELLKALKGAKQLTELKNYLHSAICQTLASYHSASSVRLELIKMMGMIEVLMEKGLMAQSGKLLAKAKKIVMEHELYSFLLELLQWEKRAMTIKEITFEKKLDKIYAEEQECLETLKTTSDYWQRRSKVNMFAKRNSLVRTSNELSEFKKHTDDLIKIEKFPSSWLGKIYFYEMNATYFEITGNILKQYQYRQECLNLFKNSALKIIQHPNAYLITLNNYLTVLLRLKKYEEVEKCFILSRSIKSYQLNNIKIREALFMIHCNELNFYLVRGEFEKGLVIIKEMEPSFKQYLKEMSDEMKLTLFINIALIYFGAGDFVKTLYWLNKIISNYTINLRNEIACFARILNLITHFELGNADLLEYVVKSTYRFLYKRGGLYKFETTILHFIKNKLPYIFNNKELIQAFIGLKEELEEIVKDPLEQKALESFDFIYWLKSKIENRPFGEILREKSRYTIEDESGH